MLAVPRRNPGASGEYKVHGARRIFFRGFHVDEISGWESERSQLLGSDRERRNCCYPGGKGVGNKFSKEES